MLLKDMKVTEQEFIAEAIDLFPDLREAFDELDNLLHRQVERFRYRVEDEMIKRNEGKVLKSFYLIEKCFHHGGKELKSAVDISFVECVFI